jgi:hypothetical protein
LISPFKLRLPKSTNACVGTKTTPPGPKQLGRAASMVNASRRWVHWTGAGWTVTLRTDVSFLNANYLFASLIWGSVGMGYFIYGKKQQSFVPMIAGLVMIGVSYFVGSALLMSLICCVILASVYLLVKQGY